MALELELANWADPMIALVPARRGIASLLRLARHLPHVKFHLTITLALLTVCGCIEKSRPCTNCLWAVICLYFELYRGQKPKMVDPTFASPLSEEDLDRLRRGDTLETLDAPNVRFFVPSVWYDEDLI
jgi:hypothetical protein